jgi:hypothetical protein
MLSGSAPYLAIMDADLQHDESVLAADARNHPARENTIW